MLTKLKENNVAESSWPEELKSFCSKLFAGAQTQVRIDPDVQAKTCTRAFNLLDRRPEGQRAAAIPEIAAEFCVEIRRFFEHSLRSQPAGEMAFGMASPMAKAGVQGCCLPHKSKGCYDNIPEKNIQDCVCKGTGSKLKKSDPHCCEKEWDMVCTENVEWFGCAACPSPEFF
jgi:hypothetical protein